LGHVTAARSYERVFAQANERNGAMRVLIAGAGGTIGKPLVQTLVRTGDEVIGLTRSRRSAQAISALGGQAVIANALDRQALSDAVRAARPEGVVHLLTAMPKRGPLNGRDLRATNRLRTEGTANLTAACEAAPVGRLVAESVVYAYGFGDSGERLRIEADQPDQAAPSRAMRLAQEAVLSLEEQVGLAARGDMDTIILRLGGLYGPGVPSSEFMLKMLRWRMMGLPGGGNGVLPWIEISDAVSAIVLALRSGAGTYNIVDDEQVTVREFLMEMARVFNTPRPYTLPYSIGRLSMPVAAHLLGRTVLRLSAAKATKELGWTPTYPSYRSGLRHWATSSGMPRARPQP
jgi:nucleoside-diphosphate-sugar epimerase